MRTIQVGDIVGDYAVNDIAGSGGMGMVYKIEHVITKRIEAMKLLPSGLSSDPEQVQRFEREIQLQARLHHPNIVALYNAVRDDDSIALVMEFVEGESLQRMVAAGPLPVETAVNFAIQVLGALAYAHESGVIHRDVSPANIIITPGLVAKLTDFGLALGATDLRLSTSGVPLGSPWYMSPEQVRGVHELDARTDLYAMGAVLHEMLTGRKLFEAEGAFAVMRAHVEAVPQPPSSLNPRVPPALDEIVSRALAKDPAMRFQSADEFRMALQSCRVTQLDQSLSLGSRLRGVHVSRSAVLIALVPGVLAAGFYAVRAFPEARHKQFPKSHAKVADISGLEGASSLVAPSTVPAPPAIPPAAPAEVPAATESSTVAALPRVKSSTRVMRRAGPVERSTSLRIIGGDSPAATIPTRDTAQAALTPEPDASKANVAETQEVTEQATTPTPSEPEVTPQAAPPANPQNGGNRFVRALGKVNPFRKRLKTEPPKNQLKQD